MKTNGGFLVTKIKQLGDPELPAKINTQSDLGLSDRINSMISSAVLLPEW